MDDCYDRLNRWIDQLQGDHPPDEPPADDPAEAELFVLAAALTALRPRAAEPDPAFLARLQATLQDGPPPAPPRRPRRGGAEYPGLH